MDKEYLIQQLHLLWNLKLNQKNGIPCCTIRINDFIIEFSDWSIEDDFIIFKFERFTIGFISINDIYEIK